MLAALVRHGHEAHVLLSKQEVEAPYEIEGVKVWGKVTDAEESERSARAMLADVIVSHLDNTHRAMRLGEWNDIPVAIIHHNTFDQTVDAVDAAGRVDLVVCNSEAMAANLADRGIKRTVAGIVCRPILGLGDQETSPGSEITLVNLREADSDNGLSKGGELFRLLAERLPERRFLGVTGAYGHQADLSDLANVDVIGHVPHHEMRDKVFARTGILLMPSSYESWGRVASEAISSGIPVIANPTAGLQENLRDAGIYRRLSEPNAWIDAIHALDDPAVRSVAAMASTDRARQLHDLARRDEARWVAAVEDLTRQEHGAL
jgi:hypothetical protein